MQLAKPMVLQNSSPWAYLILLLVFPSLVQAFPELVRHGYANCTTCHISPTGGGVLTEYGRALSAQILSTWASENEEAFLYNAVSKPDWLSPGGDIRALELFQTFNGNSSSKFILMQSDAEAAASVGSFTADATAGLDYDGGFISRRHYLIFHATDTISLRGGRFMPSFGINTENHSIGIRRGLGRDQATESYNIEAAYIGENFDTFVTAIFGRPDNLWLGAETGAAISSSVFLGSGYKIGASYFYGTRSTEQRHVAGPFAILGFTPHFFLLAELDVQWFLPKNQVGNVVWTGVVDTARLDYELIQGFHVYLMQEFLQMDVSQSNSMSDSYGGGLQFFPRPHIELNAVYLRRRIGGYNAPFGDYGYAMLHYYL